MDFTSEFIILTGNFFRTYLAPKATRYKEALLQVDLAAMVSVHGGSKKGAQRPMVGEVHDAWHSALDDLANANALQGEEQFDKAKAIEDVKKEVLVGMMVEGDDEPASKNARGVTAKNGVTGNRAKGLRNAASHNHNINDDAKSNVELELRTLNKTKQNKRSHEQYAMAKQAAFEGRASIAIRNRLFKTNEVNKERLVPPEKDKFWEFSNAIPPIRHLCRATTMWIETIWKQWSITALARTESC